MTGVACVDASVIVRLLLFECGTTSAVELMQRLFSDSTWIVGPPHLPIEVTSALYKRVRKGDIDHVQAAAAFDIFTSIGIELLSPHDLGTRAMDIAARLNLPYVYDATYLALAEMIDCDLWTADRRFYKVAHPHHARLNVLR